MPLTDVGGIPVVTTGSSGFDNGGGGWMGMLLLIALLGGGRGLFGGFGGGYGCGDGYGYGRDGGALNYHDRWVADRFNSMQNQTDFNKVESDISGVKAEIGRLGFDNAIIAKNAEIAALNCCCETQKGLAENRFIAEKNAWTISKEMSDCCCTTNRNIDSVKFQNEKDTCAVIANATANTQRIIDWLACNELKEANEKLAEKNMLLSEARIIAAMKPQAPIPAYPVPSPYAPYFTGYTGFDGRRPEGNCGFDGRGGF